MADWRSFFKGKYLSGPVLVGDVTATIARVESTLVEDPDGGEARERMIVHWRENVLPWLPCRTTGFCLAAMYGDDVDGWVGKPVTLYHDPTVRVGSETKGGIRVRGAPGIRPLAVTVKLPRRKPTTIRLVDTAPVAASLEDVLRDAGLTIEDVDRWLTGRGKGEVATMDAEKRAAFAVFLSNNPARLDEIRALIPAGREPGEEG